MRKLPHGYPGKPLGPQLRPLGEDCSAFSMLREHFAPPAPKPPANQNAHND